jgi:hypothetical protein
VGQATSHGYYGGDGEGLIITEGCQSQPGVLVDIGPGLGAKLAVMSGIHSRTQLCRGKPRRRLPEVGRRPATFGPCPGGGSRRRCVR